VKRIYLVAGGLLVVVLAAAILFWMLRGHAPGGAGDTSIAISDDDMTLGNRDAPIQFIEYASPSCPFCARFNNEVLPMLKRDYIAKGKVFYVFRVFAIGGQDIPAEALARCLPRERYFSFLDLLYQHQDIWAPDYGITNVEAGLIQIGTAAGMSFDKASACIANSEAVKNRIVRIDQEAVRKFAINATPTFVINGKVQVAGFDKASLKRYLDRLLAGK
jgi:protein-disulfide isomerase